MKGATVYISPSGVFLHASPHCEKELEAVLRGADRMIHVMDRSRYAKVGLVCAATIGVGALIRSAVWLGGVRDMVGLKVRIGVTWVFEQGLTQDAYRSNKSGPNWRSNAKRRRSL